MILLTVIVFLFIFSLLILIHELGHFAAAKKAGVKVEEFGFGLPPRMWGKKRGETLYSINWIPFGGFVRMLGEDPASKEARSKRSFMAQPLRTQAWIVTAGVVMNLILAFVLLTIGFLIGIEPLMANESDFLDSIRDGTVDARPGIVIVESDEAYKTVEYASEDIEIRSFEPGDRILAVDRHSISTIEMWTNEIEKLKEAEEGEYLLLEMDRADGAGGMEYLYAEDLEYLEFAPFYLQRLVYLESPESVFSGYLNDGDSIIKVNDLEILTEEDLYEALLVDEDQMGSIDVTVYRSGVGEISFQDVPVPVQHPVISYVDIDSPAEMLGLQVGDQILSIGGETIYYGSAVSSATSELQEDGMIDYLVLRGEEVISLSVPLREDGLIGIGISDLVPYYGDLSVYLTVVPHTLMGIEKVQYGLASPLVALQEMWRLGKVTAVMFVNVLGQFLTGGEVPAGVAGPVGIAHMTFVSLQGGFAAVLRFVALLSLSLGVINILPIPALDGGRLVFIIYEGITGRRPNPRFEYLIHTAGFFLLILFIFYITFNDVLNLF